MTKDSLLWLLLVATPLGSCGSNDEPGFFASDDAWQPTTVIKTERYVVHSPYSDTHNLAIRARLELPLLQLSWLFSCRDHDQVWFRLIPVGSTDRQTGAPQDALAQVEAIRRSGRIVRGYFTTYEERPCVVAYVPPTEPVAGISFDMETMIHELTHFFASQRQWNLPLWLDEGLACVTPVLEWNLDTETATLPAEPPPAVCRQDRDPTLWTTAELLAWQRVGEPDTVDGAREAQLYSAARSLVYFLIDDASGPLTQRLESVRQLTRDQVKGQQERWLAWVERHASRSPR